MEMKECTECRDVEGVEVRMLDVRCLWARPPATWNARWEGSKSGLEGRKTGRQRALAVI